MQTVSTPPTAPTGYAQQAKPVIIVQKDQKNVYPLLHVVADAVSFAVRLGSFACSFTAGSMLVEMGLKGTARVFSLININASTPIVRPVAQFLFDHRVRIHSTLPLTELAKHVAFLAIGAFVLNELAAVISNRDSVPNIYNYVFRFLGLNVQRESVVRVLAGAV